METVWRVSVVPLSRFLERVPVCGYVYSIIIRKEKKGVPSHRDNGTSKNRHTVSASEFSSTFVKRSSDRVHPSARPPCLNARPRPHPHRTHPHARPHARRRRRPTPPRTARTHTHAHTRAHTPTHAHTHTRIATVDPFSSPYKETWTLLVYSNNNHTHQTHTHDVSHSLPSVPAHRARHL